MTVIKTLTALAAVFSLVSVPVALAHVSVRPLEVGVATYQTFTMSVPVEKDMPTIALRLVIPEGLEHVTPTVKSGWAIETRKGEGEAVTEIRWSGGVIPKGMRDEFTFSAKAPATETTLVWKAYQTYGDGSVVSWEIEPNAEQPKNAEGAPDFSQFGPASQTKIVDDLAQDEAAGGLPSSLPLTISLTALILSVIALRRSEGTA